jgi:Sucrase/ferredoxin-like
LQREGWDVHTQLDDPTGPPLEYYPDGPEKETELNRKLQDLDDNSLPKRALILKTSHIGGHKYAGNVIVRPTLSSAVYLVLIDGARLYRSICPRALAYGMVVYQPTRSSLSSTQLSSAGKYYLLYYVGVLTSRGQIAKD